MGKQKRRRKGRGWKRNDKRGTPPRITSNIGGSSTAFKEITENVTLLLETMRGEVLPKCQEAGKEWNTNIKKIKETPRSWKQTAIGSTFCYTLLKMGYHRKIPVGIEEVASTISYV